MHKVYVSNPAQLECRSHLIEYAAKPNLPGPGVKTGGGSMLVNFFKGYTANIRHIKEKNVFETLQTGGHFRDFETFRYAFLAYEVFLWHNRYKMVKGSFQIPRRELMVKPIMNWTLSNSLNTSNGHSDWHKLKVYATNMSIY